MNERLIRHTIRGKRNFLQRGKTVHGEWKNTPRRKRQIQTAEVIDDRARKGGLCLLIVPNTGKRSSSRGGHSQAPSFPSSAPPRSPRCFHPAKRRSTHALRKKTGEGCCTSSSWSCIRGTSVEATLTMQLKEPGRE